MLASKPIEKILHLQRIVEIPGLQGGRKSSSEATTATRMSVRPQPQGLKMRFLPIGFGDGDPGSIGSDSSSVDGSTQDISDEEEEEATKQFKRPIALDRASSDTESDEAMTEAPPLSPPEQNQKPEKNAEPPTKSKSSHRKRRQREETEKKSKHSSSTSAPEPIDYKRLKRQNTKQNDSSKKSTDKALESIKTSTTPILPPKSILQKS